MPKEAYLHTEVGEKGTLDYRNYLLGEDGRQISYWHDVPLYAGSAAVNAFIEIPKNTRAKFEVVPGETANPIKQDAKNGKPRDYNMEIKWNYGALPQTWEQPDHVWEGLEGHPGDDDPVDVVDISSIVTLTGSIISVKPLAALAMLDDGEVDWKLIVINVNDPRCADVNCLEDVERVFPGEIDAIREWFTWYKATDPLTGARDASKKNVFGFDGRPLSTAEAWRVIEEAHGTWVSLVTRKVPAGKRKLA